MVHRLLMPALLPLQGTTQALAEPGGLQVAADISAVALAVISALLLLTMLVLLLQVRKLLAALQRQLQPVADRNVVELLDQGEL